MSATIGSAVKADDSEDILIRITVGMPRLYRVLAEDAARVLAGYSAVLYSEEGTPIGDVAGSASGRMLIGASRAGFGFVPDGEVFPVEAVAFMIPRDHLRAHYNRHDGPISVLAGGI